MSVQPSDLIIAPELMPYATGEKIADCKCGHASSRHSFLAPLIMKQLGGGSTCRWCGCQKFRPKEPQCQP